MTVSGRGLLGTWAALVALAGVSFGVSYLHLGRLGIVVALAIAVVKAVLVALVFMELLEASSTVRLVLIIVAAFFVLLITFMAVDVSLRPRADRRDEVRRGSVGRQLGHAGGGDPLDGRHRGCCSWWELT